MFRSRAKFVKALLFPLILLMSVATGRAVAQSASNSASSIQQVAQAIGIGKISAYIAGPGATASGQRAYAVALYEMAGSRFDVLAIDPDTGDTKVIQSPVAGEYGAYGITVGPDGNVYLGTLPTAHIMKLDTKTLTLTDLGQPAAGETYIQSLAFGSDGRLYGGTYPNGHLVSYDPSNGSLADLGRIDPTEQYAEYMAGSKDGYIYVGVGPATARVYAYQISSGKFQMLSTNNPTSVFPNVFTGTDGNIYATLGSQNYQLARGAATAISSKPSPLSPGALANSRWFSLVNTISSSGANVLQLKVLNGATNVTTTTTLPYQGEPIQVFRLGVGPDGQVYGSTLLPATLFKIQSGQSQLFNIGSVGSGEVYSLLSRGNSLLMGAYYGLSNLMSYQPAQPFAASGSAANPQQFPFTGSDASLRPQAMIQGPDGHVYVGSVAKYGSLDSPLIEWNPDDASVALHDLAPNQSTVSLTSWQSEVIGGTSIYGGGGSTPTMTSAVIYGWNTTSRTLDFTVTPVSGAKTITDLISAPNGLVYGVADTTLFEFNPSTEMVTRTMALPFGGVISNSLSVDSSGKIWGLAGSGIFLINTNAFTAQLYANSPAPITSGFARTGNTIYFVCGSAIYSYQIPVGGSSMSITPSSTTFPRSSSIQVAVSISGSGATPSGSVTLSGAGFSTQSGTLASGSYTFTVPAWLPAGTETFSVTYSGDATFLPQTGSVQVTVTNPTATPAVVVTPSSSSIMSSASLPVTVALSGSSGTPTGKVTLSGTGFTSVSGTLAGGKAVFTLPASLPVGNEVITASYAGDTVYVAGNGSATVKVAGATPSLSIVPSVVKFPRSSSIQVTAIVSGSAGTPTGTVTVSGAGFSAQTGTLASGSYTFTIPAWLPAGIETLSVSYSGDVNYLAQSGTIQVTVTNPTATPTMVVTPSSTAILSSSSLPVTVALSGGSGTPTGQVTLSGAGFASQTGTLSGGAAVFTIPAGLPVGNDAITASYGGDTVYVTLAKSATVKVAAGTPSLSIVPSATTFPRSSTLGVSVSVKGTAGTPTGTVTLSGAGFATQTGTLSSGAYSFTIPAWLPAGTETISVSYSGDVNYLAQSGTIQVTVTNTTAGVTYPFNPTSGVGARGFVPSMTSSPAQGQSPNTPVELLASTNVASPQSAAPWRGSTFLIPASFYLPQIGATNGLGEQAGPMVTVTPEATYIRWQAV